jgi:hypothetical protein
LENLKGRDLGMDGKIVIKLILKKYGVRLWTIFTWIRRESSDVNTVMNLQVPQNTSNLLIVNRLLASQKGTAPQS